MIILLNVLLADKNEVKNREQLGDASYFYQIEC